MAEINRLAERGAAFLRWGVPSIPATGSRMNPKTISHYEIVELLGEGGMGTEYSAVDTRLGRPVAIKLLRGEAAVNDESRKRFVHEARAASALNHPHIITIYDIGQDSGVDFIAMEYLAGQSLARLIERAELKIGDALKYAEQIADALSSAHAAGIVHRDIKPANIMVNERGSTKVLDFGLAKLAEAIRVEPAGEHGTTDSVGAPGRPQTEEGTILGTVAYMSPEQAEGRPADPRSDVFSFGAVLYEMVTGRRAFVGDTKMSTLLAIAGKEPERPSDVIPGLSRDLEKVILRCLRKDPERRWQAADRGSKVRAPVGDVAQLGERCVRNAEVGGSIPLISTNPFARLPHQGQRWSRTARAAAGRLPRSRRAG